MSLSVSSHRQATLIGLASILLLSTIVGLIRSVSEALGPIGGAAVMYSLSAALLVVMLGVPKLGAFPRPYLWLGSVLFVGYEVCFSLSLGFAHNARQSIEVGIVNYLWPSFTLLLTLLAGRRRITALLVLPGLLVCLLGVLVVQGGETGLDWQGIARNVRGNPLSYGLALTGAIVWSIYCVLTSRMAAGKNGIAFFFILTAIALWGQWFIVGRPELRLGQEALLHSGLAALSFGLGYAAWNIGMLRGNVTLLACASYFTPILSSAFAAVWLNTALPATFWQGALLVCGGSLASWLIASRQRQPQPTRRQD